MYCRSEKSPLPQKRITNIIEYLTYEVFIYSVRGLYENHKFLFVLLMTLKIDLQRGTVKHREFQALIKGEGLRIWMWYVKEVASDMLFDVLGTCFYDTVGKSCSHEREILCTSFSFSDSHSFCSGNSRWFISGLCSLRGFFFLLLFFFSYITTWSLIIVAWD